MEDQRKFKEVLNEKQKIQEYYNLKKNFEENQSHFRDNYGEFKKNVNNKNMRVFDNMSKYSNYINRKDNDNADFYNNRSYAVAVDPKQFKNDQDYNKNISNFKEYEKQLSRNNMFAIQEVERHEEVKKLYLNYIQSKRSQEIMDLLKKEKAQNSILYKNILDQQINSDRYIREKNKIDKDDFDGSLLPSYIYSIPSQPIYKKASDSLQMFKDNMFRNNNNTEMSNKNTINTSKSQDVGGGLSRSNQNYEKEYRKLLFIENNYTKTHLIN